MASADRIRPTLGWATWDAKRKGLWHRATCLGDKEIALRNKCYKGDGLAVPPLENERPICGAKVKRSAQWWHSQRPTDTMARLCGDCHDRALDLAWDTKD